jgi:16S rRNA (adenine1518-N6/adenine1519-N6)-dimethyltransferase
MTENIKGEIKARSISANKSLGQNFIYDRNILAKIASTQKSGSVCLEIGVGPGGLTKELAKVCKKVVGVEIDKKFESVYEELLTEDNIDIVFADFMKADLEALYKEHIGEPFGVCANLPYYITTPILMKLLDSDLPITNITILVQKEVAERIASPPGSKKYGVLSVMTQCRGEAVKLFDLQPGVFSPPPNVVSSLVDIKLKDGIIDSEISDFRKCVKSAFASRRKQLKGNIASAYGISKDNVTALLKSIGVSEKARAETLSVKEFDILTQLLNS